jgi:hypothetical protein
MSQNSCVTNITSVVKVAKITPAATVVGMQGSINRLTDVFEWFVKGGPDGAQGSEDLVMRAVELLEGEDSYIPPDQQAALITIIGLKGKEPFLKFYVNMQKKQGRHAFAAKMIGEPIAADPHDADEVEDAGGAEMTG